MTQRTESAQTPLHCFWLRTLLLQSLSWIGVLSLLSSNLVLAQTSPSPDAVVVPKLEQPQPPVADATVAKSAPDTSQSAVRLERLRQKLSLTPAPARLERPRLAIPDSPAPTRRIVRQQLNLTPAPARLERATPEAPVQARRARLLEKTTSNAATDYNGAYIDPTNYSIGATSGSEAPSRVVLSERSTGCKAVLRQGQGVSASLCGTAPQLRTRVALKGSQSINTFRLTRPQAPSWARTNRAIASVAGISPIRIGPISVTNSGFRATRSTPSFPGQIALGNATLPLQQRVVNYNPTLRPADQPGNGNTGLLFPLTIPASITSLFGWRIHPITGARNFHAGTDLGAPLGTPVLAAYAGNVVIANFLGGYGLAVVLEHNKSTQQTLYGHLSEIFVQPGEWVEQGTVIGRVGSTGNSTGPHLHFETRQLTPEGWVATDPGAQIEVALAQLVQALRTAQSTHQPGA